MKKGIAALFLILAASGASAQYSTSPTASVIVGSSTQAAVVANHHVLQYPPGVSYMGPDGKLHTCHAAITITHDKGYSRAHCNDVTPSVADFAAMAPAAFNPERSLPSDNYALPSDSRVNLRSDRAGLLR